MAFAEQRLAAYHGSMAPRLRFSAPDADGYRTQQQRRQQGANAKGAQAQSIVQALASVGLKVEQKPYHSTKGKG